MGDDIAAIQCTPTLAEPANSPTAHKRERSSVSMRALFHGRASRGKDRSSAHVDHAPNKPNEV